MKKLIYLVAIVAMVACSGKKSYVEPVVKGSRSSMDSLSYAVGANFGYGMVADTPDLKFNWDKLCDAAEKELFKDPTISSDEDHEAALALLQEFFNVIRRTRMDHRAEQLVKMDSTHKVTRADFIDFDVFETEDERNEISDAYGIDIGVRLRSMNLPLKTYWFKKGLAEAATDNAVMTIEDTQRHIQAYYTEVLPMKNSQESEAWLADVAKMKGVQKSESGLLYRIDREGDSSAMPTPSDIVKVDYEGKLRSGSIFESSYNHGQSVEFPLQNVIPGWVEGLQLIGKGGQITLWIPSEMAYGAYGSGSGVIGPNEALEFKVELHDITPAEAPAQSAEAEQAE